MSLIALINETVTTVEVRIESLGSKPSMRKSSMTERVAMLTRWLPHVGRSDAASRIPEACRKALAL